VAKFILDTRLSNDHYVICTEAIRRDIIEPEDLNEGRRTMGEQWAFWRNQPPLAAFPSPNAPHIWAGRNNHAIDSNSFNGAAKRLANFYESLGIDVHFNVPGENWHAQAISGAQLREAAKRIRRQRDQAVLRNGEREKAVKFLKHQMHYIKDPDGKPYYRPGEKKPEGGWDTLFNDGLESAVRRLQRDRKLKADGVVGQHTDRIIDRVYATQKRRRKSAKERAKARKAAHRLEKR
jgi:peptidoglycan hydrolase-like protein with peptidoglycan-binding domain